MAKGQKLEDLANYHHEIDRKLVEEFRVRCIGKTPEQRDRLALEYQQKQRDNWETHTLSLKQTKASYGTRTLAELSRLKRAA